MLLPQFQYFVLDQWELLNFQSKVSNFKVCVAQVAKEEALFKTYRLVFKVSPERFLTRTKEKKLAENVWLCQNAFEKSRWGWNHWYQLMPNSIVLKLRGFIQFEIVGISQNINTVSQEQLFLFKSTLHRGKRYVVRVGKNP